MTLPRESSFYHSLVFPIMILVIRGIRPWSLASICCFLTGFLYLKSPAYVLNGVDHHSCSYCDHKDVRSHTHKSVMQWHRT